MSGILGDKRMNVKSRRILAAVIVGAAAMAAAAVEARAQTTAAAATGQAGQAKPEKTLADNMAAIAGMWTRLAQKWVRATPDMMDQMNAACVNCHAQKDQAYRDMAEQLTKSFDSSAEALRGHLQKYADADKKSKKTTQSQ